MLVRGFGIKFFSLRGEEPWELFLTEPVPEVVELGSADFFPPLNIAFSRPAVPLDD